MVPPCEDADVRWEHITSHSDDTGRLFVGVSKADQEGEGTLLFISRRTMTDLDAISPEVAADGPVFGLHPRTVADTRQVVGRWVINL